MKKISGQVIDTKAAKTARVAVLRIRVHPLYKKRFKIKKIYHVHDELGVKLGDEVKFQSCKPVSKTKKWQIVEIVGQIGKKSKDKKETKDKQEKKEKKS